MGSQDRGRSGIEQFNKLVLSGLLIQQKLVQQIRFGSWFNKSWFNSSRRGWPMMMRIQTLQMHQESKGNKFICAASRLHHTEFRSCLKCSLLRAVVRSLQLAGCHPKIRSSRTTPSSIAVVRIQSYSNFKKNIWSHSNCHGSTNLLNLDATHPPTVVTPSLSTRSWKHMENILCRTSCFTSLDIFWLRVGPTLSQQLTT